MVQATDIGWGTYRGWEGPFYRGKFPLLLPDGRSPSEAEKILAVITATEGGHYDAINMYDGQILSSGLIQFIERGQFSVSQMLGDALDGDYGNEFLRFVASKNATFVRGEYGHYRFLLMRSPIPRPVDTLEEQQRLFFLNSTGEKGTWDDESKAHAKSWAAAVATFWEHVPAQCDQVAFTISKLYGFAVGEGRALVEDARRYNSALSNAFVASYLSFAVNNPQRALKHLRVHLGKTKESRYTRAWLVEYLKEATFGPGIAIYPHRYNAIRPVLERMYGCDLPDFAEDLKSWMTHWGFSGVISTVELQKSLMILGYDLGPCGADGKYGSKTKEALLLFEQASGVPAEFCDGMLDHHTYPILEKALWQRGAMLLAEKA